MFRALLLIGALFTTFEASAIDMDYYAPNGMPTVAEAFRRMALIFSDVTYKLFFASIAIGGMLLAFANGFIIRPIMEGFGKNNGVGWIAPFLIGGTIYLGAFATTGTMHIYDPVKNDTQSVVGVPNLIVVVAGLGNKIERAMIDITDTASAYPYSSNAGGISLQLFLEANYKGYENKKKFLQQDLQAYYAKCGKIGLTIPGNKNTQQMMGDVDSLNDILTEWWHPSVWVNMHNGVPALTNMSCTEARDTVILPSLNLVNFSEEVKEVCAKNGYDVFNTLQLNACKNAISDSNKIHGNLGGSAESYLRDSFIANTIMNQINLENPEKAQETLMRRDLVLQGLGAMSASNDTMPNLKAVMTAIILGIMPFLCLFLVTPLWLKSLKFITGSILWLVTWGVMMAVMHTATMDSALTVLSDIESNKMGIDAFMLAQTDGVKAMMLFGRMQSNSLMMASAIAIAVFGFGSYALTGMAQSQAGSIQRIGEGAAQSSLTPEGRTELRQGLSGGVASDAGVGHVEGVTNGLSGSGYAALHQENLGNVARNVGSGSETDVGVSRGLGEVGAQEGKGRFEGLEGSGEHNNISPGEQAFESAKTSAITHQTQQDAQGFIQDNLSSDGTPVDGANQIAFTNAFKQFGGIDNARNMTEFNGGDPSNKEDLMSTITEMSNNNGGLAMTGAEIMNNSQLMEGRSEGWSDFVGENQDKDFIVHPSFNSEGELTSAPVSANFGVNADESTKESFDNIMTDKNVVDTRNQTSSGSHEESGNRKVHDSTTQSRVGPNVGGLRNAILNTSDTFDGNKAEVERWGGDYGAFTNSFNGAKFGGDEQAREQLVDATTEMFKDVQGTMSTQDMISFFSSQQGGWQVPGIAKAFTGASGGISVGSDQRSESTEAIRTEINRSYVNNLLDNSKGNGDFAKQIRESHEQQRAYATGQGKDSDMKSVVK